MGLLNKANNSLELKSDNHIRVIRNTSSVSAPKEAEALARKGFRLVAVFKDRNEYVWVFQHDWTVQKINDIEQLLAQNSQ